MSRTIPSPGMTVPTLPNARTLLVRAQGIAADAFNAPRSSKPDTLLRGAYDAKAAAAMLLNVEPRSKFQDLPAASQLARQGADALGRAAVAWTQELPAPLAFANVKQHADVAFKAFEDAFEIIDND